MHKFWNLVKRHCLVFLRDKTAVFFSFLAMIIIIVLMGVFLSKMNVDSILSLLEQFRHSKATATDRKNATELVNYCILAGILMTNSLTVSTSVIGIYIDDIKSHAIDCFYSAPVKRSIVSLSYIAAAMMISMMMCLATFGVFFGIYRFRRRRDAFADESAEGYRGNCAQRRFVFDRRVRDFAWAQKFKGLVDACKHFRNAGRIFGRSIFADGLSSKRCCECFEVSAFFARRIDFAQKLRSSRVG